MKSRIAMLACAALIAGATGAQAQQEVKVGVLYPLSGPTAQIGIDAVAAVKTVLEIVNDGADLPLPLAKGKGLSGLGGAKVTVAPVTIRSSRRVLSVRLTAAMAVCDATAGSYRGSPRRARA